MKIVFFGTSDVGLPILEALLKEHEVISVVTSPDALVGRKQILTPSPIAQFAAQNNLPLLKPEKARNNPELIAQLQNLNVDIFIVVSYGKILPEELLNIPPLKTVNVHFSLLPKYRGASPIQFALLNGETETGTTIFVLDEQVDHGPIIAQAKLDIQPDDTFLTLAPKLSQLSADLLLENLPKYQNKTLTPFDQDHLQATKATLINKQDGKIAWSKTAQEIYNQYRAFIAWPGIWTTWQDKTLKILKCVPTLETEIPPIKIPCGNNTFLRISELQLEGKKPTTDQEFLNGYPNFNVKDLK